MFNVNDKALQCPSCLESYVEPYVLPCGQSVCARCMLLTFNTTNAHLQMQGLCTQCSQVHVVPPQGFAANVQLMQLLDRKKKMKSGDDNEAPTPADALLKSHVNEIRARKECLSSMMREARDNIAKHCEFVREELQLAVESFMEHIAKRHGQLVADIDTYEVACLANMDSASLGQTSQRRADRLATRVQTFCDECTTTRSLDEQELVDAIDKAKLIKSELETEELISRSLVFNKRMLRYVDRDDDDDDGNTERSTLVDNVASLFGSLTLSVIAAPFAPDFAQLDEFKPERGVNHELKQVFIGGDVNNNNNNNNKNNILHVVSLERDGSLWINNYSTKSASPVQSALVAFGLHTPPPSECRIMSCHHENELLVYIEKVQPNARTSCKLRLLDSSKLTYTSEPGLGIEQRLEHLAMNAKQIYGADKDVVHIYAKPTMQHIGKFRLLLVAHGSARIVHLTATNQFIFALDNAKTLMLFSVDDRKMKVKFSIAASDLVFFVYMDKYVLDFDTRTKQIVWFDLSGRVRFKETVANCSSDSLSLVDVYKDKLLFKDPFTNIYYH